MTNLWILHSFYLRIIDFFENVMNAIKSLFQKNTLSLLISEDFMALLRTKDKAPSRC